MRSPDRQAPTAASIRRRTRCVYCGTRIPGSLDELPGPFPPLTTEERSRLRLAARVACKRHLGLPAVDPAYEYSFARLAAKV